MTWTGIGQSDRGQHRPRNEDSFLVRPDVPIYAVADGMGGHAAGDVASGVAISVLDAAFEQPVPADDAAAMASRLLEIFHTANATILDHASTHRETAGMGTTLTALAPLASTAECVIAHIGDSRAYRLRNGSFAQLTQDHTWVQEQVDSGTLTSQQARNHPLSNVLSRVLGTPTVGPVDTFIVDAQPGDVFLLCSDGLTTMVDDSELRTILDRDLPIERRARDLIDAANQYGGDDNITVVLIQPVRG